MIILKGTHENLFLELFHPSFCGFYLLWPFWKLGFKCGGYIEIYYHDGDCIKVTVLYSKAHPSPPRAILTPARVGQYYGHTHIYIPPYAVPPTTLTPGSRVSGLWDLGSRVSMVSDPAPVTIRAHLGFWLWRLP